jgi:hypothetical protein
VAIAVLDDPARMDDVLASAISIHLTNDIRLVDDAHRRAWTSRHQLTRGGNTVTHKHR